MTSALSGFSISGVHKTKSSPIRQKRPTKDKAILILTGKSNLSSEACNRPPVNGVLKKNAASGPVVWMWGFYRDALTTGDWQVLTDKEEVTGGGTPLSVEDTPDRTRFCKIEVRGAVWQDPYSSMILTMETEPGRPSCTEKDVLPVYPPEESVQTPPLRDSVVWMP